MSGGQQGDALGDREHLVVEVGLREGPVGPAQLHGLGAGDRVAGDHHLHGGAHAEQPGVELHVGHAEADRGVAHLGVGGHVDEVAPGGQLAAAGQAVAVDLGDDRLLQVPDAHPGLGDVPGPLALARRGEVRVLVALVAAAEVVAGREARAGAADDRHVDVVVEVGGLERLDELTAERVVQGVALLGPVEREAAHVGGGVVDEDERVGHGEQYSRPGRDRAPGRAGQQGLVRSSTGARFSALGLTPAARDRGPDQGSSSSGRIGGQGPGLALRPHHEQV